MIASASVPISVSPQARARIAALGLQTALQRMIDYMRQNVLELTRIEVVLYDRDESGEEPGVAVEAYVPFESFDASGQTRARTGEWLVSEFSPAVLEHVTIDYLPEAPDAR
jgi:hypothetical protein